MKQARQKELHDLRIDFEVALQETQKRIRECLDPARPEGFDSLNTLVDFARARMVDCLSEVALTDELCAILEG
jgi:hypothetical protein